MLPSEAPRARDLEDSHVSFLPFASFRVRAALDERELSNAKSLGIRKLIFRNYSFNIL